VVAHLLQIKRDCARCPDAVRLEAPYLSSAAEHLPEIGRTFEYFLNTGNLSSRSGLDLSQASGFTVVAEKLNFFRYISHFRAVHRGAYFTELRTTTVRKLLPESFGFLCPVHTPDGALCGLLNHFAHRCNIVADDAPEGSEESLLAVLVAAGMAPAEATSPPHRLPLHIPVTLDGRVIGYLAKERVPAVVHRLRQLKGQALSECTAARLVPGQSVAGGIPFHVEVAYMPYERGGPYPGLFLQTQQGRMMRVVRQAKTRQLELIGTLEQSSMHIRCLIVLHHCNKLPAP
jgi:DNA-directed RNA polymerase I subunit RPA2